jgi:NAD(P)-dependent dehydrogenase (short-subunit alcohol dehydrogenase family)
MSIAVITGANRGIGLELARQMSERGDTIVAAVRRSSPELEALGAQIIDGVDVGDDASTDALTAGLDRAGVDSVDILINNAGILRRETLDALDFDSIRQQFEINSLGPLRMTAAVLPRMRAGGKIAIITSRMGSIADNTSGSRYGYRMSKAAVNMAGVSLAHDVADRGIAVIILHPGFVRTGMTGGAGDVSAAESATGLLAQIDALTPATSGQFLHAKGQALPW